MRSILFYQLARLQRRYPTVHRNGSSALALISRIVEKLRLQTDTFVPQMFRDVYSDVTSNLCESRTASDEGSEPWKGSEPSSSKYSLELMERGARMVMEMREATDQSRGAVVRVARQLGVQPTRGAAALRAPSRDRRRSTIRDDEQ